jgi:hypothetical protein
MLHHVKFHQDAGLNGKMFASGSEHHLTPVELDSMHRSCTLVDPPKKVKAKAKAKVAKKSKK